MSAKTRQDSIIEILEKQGYVTVKYLTEVLHYSSATVNRDLNALQSQQLVVRKYGGVELVRSSYVPVYFRAHKTRVEKKYIGKAAASLVKDGDTIFIDGSTTAQCMEQYLIHRKNLTVVTNNIVLAAKLSGYDVKVVCLGGTIVEAPSMLYGTETVENAERYRVDKMFFATSAVSSDGMIASGVYDLMLRTVAKRASEVFYLVDHQKIDQPFNSIFCDLGSVDCVISDYTFSDEIKAKYPKTRFVTVEIGENG
ncbi:MAG: DeoR/GlpR transcriptional regulator [Clostridia bacterium]|nr:DeoR/GlpR transcriptional regulator [Clostridia bacterium]